MNEENIPKIGIKLKIMYAGASLIATGLVIMAVGLGEKGFKAGGLHLVGPIFVILGAVMCFVSIALCYKEKKEHRLFKRTKSTPEYEETKLEAAELESIIESEAVENDSLNDENSRSEKDIKVPHKRPKPKKAIRVLKNS